MRKRIDYTYNIQEPNKVGNSLLLQKKTIHSISATLRLCYGCLGRDVCVPLPACAVHEIRQTFPSLNYHGFQGPQ